MFCDALNCYESDDLDDDCYSNEYDCAEGVLTLAVQYLIVRCM